MTEAAKKTLRQHSITVNHFIPFRFFFFFNPTDQLSHERELFETNPKK